MALLYFSADASGARSRWEGLTLIPRRVALIQSSDEIKELLRKRFLHELIVHCSQIGSDVALGRRTEDWAGLFTGSGERKGLQRGPRSSVIDMRCPIISHSAPTPNVRIGPKLPVNVRYRTFAALCLPPTSSLELGQSACISAPAGHPGSPTHNRYLVLISSPPCLIRPSPLFAIGCWRSCVLRTLTSFSRILSLCPSTEAMC